MKINVYYGGRGLLDDPTLYVLNKMEDVLKVLSELNLNRLLRFRTNKKRMFSQLIFNIISQHFIHLITKKSSYNKHNR